jgi:hypothetical protein
MPGDPSGDAGAEGSEPELRPAPKLGGRVIKVAALGGAVALLLSGEVRNRLLDLLFGAEEEFDYRSVTEPIVPGTPSAAEVPGDATAPWVTSAVETPDETAEVPEPPPAAPWAPRAVAPSPAAWGETPPAGTETPPPIVVDVPTQSGGAPDSPAPPAPPRDWWSPDSASSAPTD